MENSLFLFYFFVLPHPFQGDPATAGSLVLPKALGSRTGGDTFLFLLFSFSLTRSKATRQRPGCSSSPKRWGVERVGIHFLFIYFSSPSPVLRRPGNGWVARPPQSVGESNRWDVRLFYSIFVLPHLFQIDLAAARSLMAFGSSLGGLCATFAGFSLSKI